jgi:hypothetical protein
MATINPAVRTNPALQPQPSTAPQPAGAPAHEPEARGPRTAFAQGALQQRPKMSAEGSESSRPPRADMASLTSSLPGVARSDGIRRPPASMLQAAGAAPAAAAAPPAPATAPSAAHVRTQLQQAVDRLGQGGPASKPSATQQLDAHQAVLAYGSQAGTLADRIVPGYHKAMTTLATALTGGDKKADLNTDPAQWLGQKLAGPALNMVGRQQVALPPEAIVPDEMVDLMNKLDPGAGEALRNQVTQQQQELGSAGSASNQKIGQVVSGLATVAQKVAQDPSSSSTASPHQKAAVDTMISASAGAATGAAQAFQAGKAKVEVPDMEALRKAQVPEGASGKDVLARLPTQSAPLSYSRHKPMAERTSEFKESTKGASIAQYASAALRVGMKAMDAIHPDKVAAMLMSAAPFVAGSGAGAPVAAAMTGVAAALGAYATVRPYLETAAQVATAVA